MRALVFTSLLLSLTALTPFTVLAQDDRLEVRLDELRESSCPKGTDNFPLASVNIRVKEAELGSTRYIEKTFPDGIKFIKGWHLTSDNTDFGGLSGIDILPNGDLLTVSDKGHVFAIGMRDHAPNGSGAMTPLLDRRGKPLTGKMDADAEGVSYFEGLVFISFERKHRVLAYDLFQCGAASRGAKVVNLPDKLLKKKVAKNNGAEALDIKNTGEIIVGFEMEKDGQAPLLTIPLTDKKVEGSHIKTVAIPAPYSLVGLSDSASLYRTYDKQIGNRNIIRWDYGRSELTLTPPLNVDNFEGIVETKTDDGRRLVYIISDDNFSARQRTLLYLFEITDTENK